MATRSPPAGRFSEPGENLHALALTGARDGIWDWDRTADRVYYDPQWKALAGYGPDELSDGSSEWLDRVHPDDLPEVNRQLKVHIAGTTAYFRSEHRMRHSDGTYRWVLVRGTAIRNGAGEAVRIVGLLTDINEQKQNELRLHAQLDEMRFALASEKVLMEELDRKNRELTELSITDGLTGLYNHRFLQQRFDFEYKRTRRYGGELCCLLMDIDHFKKINDTYGHQFGDYVLKRIAAIIKSNSREVDICGRYGGEEFLIIANLTRKNAIKFALKLHDAIEAELFEHPSAMVKATVSIGIAECTNEVKTRQELIERADRAMYQAKKDGRNLVRVWKDVITTASGAEQYGVEELREKFRGLSVQMQSAYIEATDALVKAVEAKDSSAHEHSGNVARYAVAIAREMRLPAEQIEVIKFGAILHDIGKISIPDSILQKEGALTARERRIVQQHPEVGVSILRDIRFLEKELPIVLSHHERFDGKGYPHGLSSYEIPLGARIVAVVDAFDRMVHARAADRVLTEKKAAMQLVREKGKRFSPEIVDAFLKSM
ncbi:MAG: diguanylate cyclase [Chitinispirillaceae bacterium]|nr:diguanylate cyclase [Chitinispirillaceae bacterium]